MTASRELLLRAANLLDQEAELTRQSCEIAPHDWACADCRDKENCEPRKHYAEMKRTVRELLEAA